MKGGISVSVVLRPFGLSRDACPGIVVAKSGESFTDGFCGIAALFLLCGAMTFVLAPTGL